MRSLLIVGAMLLAFSPAIAQEHNHPAAGAQAPASQQSGGMMMQGGMDMQGMGAMLGQHMMPVTVTAIDSKTGLVDAMAGTMALKLHFPPPALAGVKVGDKISVHLAFHKS